MAARSVLTFAVILALSCVGAEAWTPPVYNKTVSDAFRSKVCINPIKVTSDPYAKGQIPPPPANETVVCGVLYTDEKLRTNYTLHTYPSPAAALAAGAHITHQHACGACSTTADLAVYMASSDLTEPTRKCGEKGFVSQKWAVKCLRDIGFTEQCANVWFYNTRNTRKECLWVCLKNLHTPNNVPMPHGPLNPCLQCDEDKSGPVFKTYAGRTRRDSGLSSAIYRPPSTIYHVEHYYY